MKRGDRLAWTETAYLGTTNGISSVHRFGVNKLDDEHGLTMCGREFPRAEKRQFPLLSSLFVCGDCEDKWAEETAAIRRSA